MPGKRWSLWSKSVFTLAYLQAFRESYWECGNYSFSHSETAFNIKRNIERWVIRISSPPEESFRLRASQLTQGFLCTWNWVFVPSVDVAVLCRMQVDLCIVANLTFLDLVIFRNVTLFSYVASSSLVWPRVEKIFRPKPHFPCLMYWGVGVIYSILKLRGKGIQFPSGTVSKQIKFNMALCFLFAAAETVRSLPVTAMTNFLAGFRIFTALNVLFGLKICLY